MHKSNFLEEFSETSSSEWKQRIVAELKGVNFEETLVWKSPEEINVKPFYHSEDLKKSRKLSYGKPSWKINQSIFVKGDNEANLKALDEIKKGAESLYFIVPSNKVNIEKLLQGIDTETTSVHFEFQFLDASYFNKILDFDKKEESNVYLNLDCIGYLARSGNWFFDEEKDFEILNSLHGRDPKNIFSVDTSLYQNAGANVVQQLAYALAHVNEYFTRSIIDSVITFKVSVGSNYFFEIAKLKALRWLFEILAEEYDLKLDCHIIAEPAKRNKTIYEYNSNMLRTTTESMAAILGGADTVCNLPYDSIYHKSNEFGDRIARNQLLILKNESYFSKVYNPADGTYYIEALTQELAEKALQKFKDIEAQGGFLKLLKTGTIQKEIAESAQLEQEKFDKKEIVLVGTNAYQNSDDRIKEDLGFDPFQEKDLGRTIIEPIRQRRLAAGLEQKRLNDE